MRDALIMLLAVIYLLQLALAALQALILVTDFIIRVIQSLVEF